MAKQYNPRHFFRNVSNELLAAYFVSKQTLTGFDFQGLPEAKINPLYTEWGNLPDAQRQDMESDFREIHSMAHEGAAKAFIDEAKYHEEDISSDLSRLPNHFDRAFWTFLNRPHYWQGATRFLHVDMIAASFWIRRTDIPQEKPKLSGSRITGLEQAVGQFFYEQQGRGRNCHIEHYRRNDLLYLFAYPEDYTQASVGGLNSSSKGHLGHQPLRLFSRIPKMTALWTSCCAETEKWLSSCKTFSSRSS